MSPSLESSKPVTLKIGIAATEPSGDFLGAELISALQQKSGNSIKFVGVGGDAMQAAGLKTLFAIDELAVIGPVAIIAAIPRGYRLAKRLVNYFADEDIDVLIIIDSPEFNHPVARWLRAKNSTLPIFNLVAPTVWAWRAGRARKMKPYINEVLAVLPFEPDVFTQLDGPACTFVGHPAIDRAKRNTMTGQAFREKYKISGDQPLLVLLPGSRRGEIIRHMPIFAETVKRFLDRVGEVQIVLPIIPHVKNEVASQLQKSRLDVLQIEGEDEKWGAFRAADLALAASGTVTLELAATHTPMIVAYRLDLLASLTKWLINVHSVVLPNLVMQENVVAEYIHRDCTTDQLFSALVELFQSLDMRDKQREFLKQAAIRVGSNNKLGMADRAAQAIFERLNLEV